MASQTAPSLSRKQRLAVPVVAGGGTLDQAAEAADVSARTITRWRSEDAFADAVRDAQGVIYRDALAILAGGMADAARHLVEVAAGRQAVDSGRIHACKLVLTLATVHREQLELVDRIAALEAVA